MDSLQSRLLRYGWAYLPFNLTERQLAEYTTSAREVIEVAVDDPAISDALTLDLAEPAADAGSKRIVAGTFGLSRARTLGLDANKYTLQLGYQSRAYAGSRIDESAQPLCLRNFWTLHEVVLRAVVDTVQSLLTNELLAGALAHELLPANLALRNVHIRTNWYQQALERENGPPKEILSGHADRGAITLHLFETHGGYLQGAPYPKGIALSDDGPIRRGEVTRMIARLLQLSPGVEQAIFFLGVGWWYLSRDLLPERLAQLPALYHVGRQPAAGGSTESPFAATVINGHPDRLSVVAFIDPPLSLHKDGRYSVPPRRVARPELRAE